jgi:hypothetical protein
LSAAIFAHYSSVGTTVQLFHRDIVLFDDAECSLRHISSMNHEHLLHISVRAGDAGVFIDDASLALVRIIVSLSPSEFVRE